MGKFSSSGLRKGGKVKVWTQKTLKIVDFYNFFSKFARRFLEQALKTRNLLLSYLQVTIYINVM